MSIDKRYAADYKKEFEALANKRIGLRNNVIQRIKYLSKIFPDVPLNKYGKDEIKSIVFSDSNSPYYHNLSNMNDDLLLSYLNTLEEYSVSSRITRQMNIFDIINNPPK